MFPLKWGNKKLNKNTLIINMSAAIDCSSLKLGLCHITNNSIAHCYARKAEKLYGQKIIDYRRAQANEWESRTADSILQEFKEKIRKRKTPTNFLRYNESGDFNNQSDIEKLSTIARGLKEEFGIVTFGYTARSDLDFSSAEFIVKGSGWNGPGLKGSTTVITKIDKIPKGYTLCPESNQKHACSECNLCKCNFNFNIAFLKH